MFNNANNNSAGVTATMMMMLMFTVAAAEQQLCSSTIVGKFFRTFFGAGGHERPAKLPYNALQSLTEFSSKKILPQMNPNS